MTSTDLSQAADDQTRSAADPTRTTSTGDEGLRRRPARLVVTMTATCSPMTVRLSSPDKL